MLVVLSTFGATLCLVSYRQTRTGVARLADDTFHLIPAEDATSHTAAVDCPCAPVAGVFHRLVAGDATVWTHHAFEHRGDWADK